MPVDTVALFPGAAKVAPGYLEHAFAGTWDIPDGDNPTLAGLKQAHLAARQGWAQLYKVHTNLMRSPSARDKPLETLQRSASHARQRISAVQKQVALAVEAAQVNLDLVNGQLAKVLNPPELTAADVTVMAEIRAHVRALDHDAREAFMQAAFAAGDQRTLRAVVGAPHYLIGTIPQTHQRWRDEFLKVTAPGLVEAHNNLERGIELAQVAAKSIEVHAREAIDFVKAADLDALAKELEGV